MKLISPEAVSPLHALWEFVKSELVEELPEDLAICEFDCRKRQCTQAESATCQRRISKGAGELFPAQKVTLRVSR